MVAAVVFGVPGAAAARVLGVGQGAEYPTLPAAVGAAKDGDTLRLEPGEYFECAAVSQNDLVIEGRGAVLTDKTCEGKAILVLHGNRTIIRDLVLARARVPDGNGAGIRLEGEGLLLERVRFSNNQVALLGGGSGDIRIEGCIFQGGGVGLPRPLSAIMVGAPALLRIKDSTFKDEKGGQIVSSALHTELDGNRIAGGLEPEGPPLVTVAGETLLMLGNTLSVGPHAPARAAAVLMTGATATLRANHLENAAGRPLTLLLDWSASAPLLDANVVPRGDDVSSTSGSWRHKAGNAAQSIKSSVRGAAGSVKRGVKGMLGW